MFKTILVPLDGSPLAECVLPHVLAVSQVFQSEICLLSVLNDTGPGKAQPVDPIDWQMRRAEAESYLRDVSRRIRDLGFNVTWNVIEGPPAECVVDAMRGRTTALLVLSTHGQTGHSRWTSGSVIRKVVQSANASVMIVRAFKDATQNGTSPASYHRVLLPLDGSRRAECVLPLASSIAEFHEAEIQVVHAVSKPEMACRCPLSTEDRDLQHKLIERNRQTANEYLGNIRYRLPARTQTKLIVGDNVAASLHEISQSSNADLIVLSAHGYSGQRIWPYGSVCRSFIDYGTLPLLIVQDLQCEDLEATAAEMVAQEHSGH